MTNSPLISSVPWHTHLRTGTLGSHIHTHTPTGCFSLPHWRKIMENISVSGCFSISFYAQLTHTHTPHMHTLPMAHANYTCPSGHSALMENRRTHRICDQVIHSGKPEDSKSSLSPSLTHTYTFTHKLNTYSMTHIKIAHSRILLEKRWSRVLSTIA